MLHAIQADITTLAVDAIVNAANSSLRGALRDPVSRQRRPLVRFFACQQDLSHQPPDAPLPEAVASGKEPLLVVLAIAGG